MSISHSRWISSASVTLVLASSVSAGSFIVSIEAPGVENTTSAGTHIVENFDSVPVGGYTKLQRPIGTYNIDPAGLGNFEVKGADQYGGAGGQANYLVNVRPLSGNGGITLNLGGDQSYFGFYWSAGSPDTVVFSEKGQPVFTYTTQNVRSFIGTMPNASLYYGNPDQPFLGYNSSEPYAFINFYAPSGTSFDSVYFKGDLLETDNHTVLAASSPPTHPSGVIVPTVVPEPAETAFVIGGSLGVMAIIRRRLKN